MTFSLVVRAVWLLAHATSVEIPAHDSATLNRSDGMPFFCVNATGAPIVVELDDRGPVPPAPSCQVHSQGFRCVAEDVADAFACSAVTESVDVVDVYLSSIATDGLTDEVRDLVEALVVGEAKQQVGVRVATIFELRRSLDDAALAMANGCVSEACLPDVARVIGARYATTAQATLVDGELSLTLALLDAKAGHAVSHETVHARRLEALSQLLTVAVHNLFVPLTGRTRLLEPVIETPPRVDDPAAVIFAVTTGLSASLLLALSTTAITAAGSVAWLVLEPDAPIVAAVWQIMALMPLMLGLPVAMAGAIFTVAFLVDLLGPPELPLAHATTAAAVAAVAGPAGLLLGQAGGLGIALVALYVIAAATGTTDYTVDGPLFRTYGGPLVVATPALVMLPIVVGTGLLTGGAVLATVALNAAASDFDGRAPDAE
jgi:hypothetical protein